MLTWIGGGVHSHVASDMQLNTLGMRLSGDRPWTERPSRTGSRSEAAVTPVQTCPVGLIVAKPAGADGNRMAPRASSFALAP